MRAASSTDFRSPMSGSLRKGTHSCLECRRRKVRCVIKPGCKECEECLAREAQCTRQVPRLKPAPQDEHTTRRRMQDLEALVGKVTATLTPAELATSGVPASISCEGNNLPSGAFSSNATVNTPASSISTGQDPPVLSLFDNTILSRNFGGKRTEHSPPRVTNAKTERLMRDCKCMLPNARDLNHILQHSPDSWRLWYSTFPNDFKPNLALLTGAILSDFIYAAINSDDLGVVAKVALCLAIHIQQLPRHFTVSYPNLPLSLEALRDCCLNAAEGLLGPDEELAASLDGLACMMIQSEYYINAGKPRKVWLILRRAIGFAQLLGYHRSLDGTASIGAISGKTLFLKLWQSDREVSLILGLPYAVPDSFLGSDTGNAERATGGADNSFLLKLGIVTGRTIHRNQNQTKTAFAATLEIDQELEECHEMMPRSWWQALSGSGLSPEESFAMLVMKLRYYNVQKLLHLPFMLKAYTNTRYDFSRCSALEAARDMIRIYQILRGPGGSLLKMCAMVDFEIFTAGMVLIIDLLADSRKAHTVLPQHNEDWGMVRSLAHTLSEISATMNCRVAEQAGRLLNDFYEAHHNQSYADEEVYEASIPYFGKLHIRRNQSAIDPMDSSTASMQRHLTDHAEAATTPNSYPAFSVSFEDYHRGISEMFQPAQCLSSSWMSTMAVEDYWTWTPHTAGV